MQTHATTHVLRPLWMAVALFGFALLLFLSLTRLPHHVLLFPYGDKLEHIAAFACLQIWLTQLYPRKAQRLTLMGLFLLLALVLEFAQRLIGGFQHMEWGDVLASWVGVVLATWAVRYPSIDGFIIKLERCLLHR